MKHKSKFDVITIGAATADILISSSAFVPTGRLLKFSQSSKNEIDTSRICSGGGATNAAVTFARHHLITAPISLVGTDPLSEYIFSDLKAEKINPSFIVRQKNISTDFSIIVVSSKGHRSIFTNRGTTRLEAKNIPWGKIKNTSWFYITSLEGNLDLLEKIIGFAKENNIKIALNPGSRELKNYRLINQICQQVDFLLLNRQEAESYSQKISGSLSFWSYFENQHPLVAITDGQLGAHLIDRFHHLHSPVKNILPVDETGAGDAFGSALISALIHRQSPATALSWAIKNSASVVSYLGAKKGILNLTSIKK